jgi:hypothetical protein
VWAVHIHSCTLLYTHPYCRAVARHPTARYRSVSADARPMHAARNSVPVNSASRPWTKRMGGGSAPRSEPAHAHTFICIYTQTQTLRGKAGDMGHGSGVDMGCVRTLRSHCACMQQSNKPCKAHDSHHPTLPTRGAASNRVELNHHNKHDHHARFDTGTGGGWGRVGGTRGRLRKTGPESPDKEKRPVSSLEEASHALELGGVLEDPLLMFSDCV